MQNDYIIMLAWPEGYVKAAGAWYDKIFSVNGKYRVGHSAAVSSLSFSKSHLSMHGSVSYFSIISS